MLFFLQSTEQVVSYDRGGRGQMCAAVQDSEPLSTAEHSWARAGLVCGTLQLTHLQLPQPVHQLTAVVL